MRPDLRPEERIIVALDVPTVEAALQLVEKLAPHVGLFKIGLELIYTILADLLDAGALLGGGPCETTRNVAEKRIRRADQLFQLLKGKIFLDGKLHDIPNTVAGAVKAIAKLEVAMFNVHASAGTEAMKRAVESKGSAMVLAVTVLTSLRAVDIFELGYPSMWPCVLKIEHYHGYDIDGKDYLWPLVAKMALCAKKAGCDGIICSPREIVVLRREEEFKNILIVTPGIRAADALPDDQKRTMSPTEAIRAGADYLVVGRPITGAKDPVEAAKKIAEEIAAAMSA